MIQYKLPIVGTDQLFQVKEYTRDAQIKYVNGVASQIQVWRCRDYFLNGTFIRSDSPWCVVFELNDLTNPTGDVLTRGIGPDGFGPTGLSIAQALTVLNTILSNDCPIPVNAAEGSTIREELPTDVGETLTKVQADLTTARADYLATTEGVASAGVVLSDLKGAVASTEADLAATKLQLDAAVQALADAQVKAEMSKELLDTQISEKQDTIARLDAAIKEKSTISTNLTLNPPSVATTDAVDAGNQPAPDDRSSTT